MGIMNAKGLKGRQRKDDMVMPLTSRVTNAIVDILRCLTVG